ncbi:unnamed protein product [Absidia cylindrospora]
MVFDDETVGSTSSTISSNSNSCQEEPLIPIAPKRTPSRPQLKPNVARFIKSTPSSDFVRQHPLATETSFEKTNAELDNDDISTKVDITDLDERDIAEPSDIGQHTNSLAKASLSHVAAKDRHEEFQSLLTESAALVERMIGGGSHSTLGNNTHQNDSEASNEGTTSYASQKQSHTATTVQRSGSVLGSLMRLEHQLQHPRPPHSATKIKKGNRNKIKTDVTFEDDKIIVRQRTFFM